MNNQKSKEKVIAYAWVILAVLFIAQVASFGMRTSFGAYISPWEQEFSASRTLVTSISMLSFVVFAFAQPIAGKLNDYFGKGIVPTTGVFLVGLGLLFTSRANHIWQVYLLFGVAFALGIAGCSNVISASILSKWFVGKRGFAFGLATSGMAVGQLIMVPTNLFLVERLGWRTTMATLSIIIMAVSGSLCIFLLRSKPEEKGMKPYGYVESAEGGGNHDSDKIPKDSKKTLPVLGALKHKAFWMLTIPYFVCGFTDVGLINTHLIPMAEGKGFPEAYIAAAFILIAISNIAGSVITGHLSDHFNRKRQLATIFTIRAVTFVFLIIIGRPWLLLPFAVIYGAVEMASIAPTHSMTVQFFERYSIGAVLGLVNASHQLGGAVGSWVPGYLYDLTKSYSSVMMLCIVMLVGASLLALRIPEFDKQ